MLSLQFPKRCPFLLTVVVQSCVCVEDNAKIVWLFSVFMFICHCSWSSCVWEFAAFTISYQLFSMFNADLTGSISKLRTGWPVLGLCNNFSLFLCAHQSHGGTVVWWLALSPHKEKVLCSNASCGHCLELTCFPCACVGSLRVHWLLPTVQRRAC